MRARDYFVVVLVIGFSWGRVDSFIGPASVRRSGTQSVCVPLHLCPYVEAVLPDHARVQEEVHRAPQGQRVIQPLQALVESGVGPVWGGGSGSVSGSVSMAHPIPAPSQSQHTGRTTAAPAPGSGAATAGTQRRRLLLLLMTTVAAAGAGAAADGMMAACRPLKHPRQQP